MPSKGTEGVSLMADFVGIWGILEFETPYTILNWAAKVGGHPLPLQPSAPSGGNGELLRTGMCCVEHGQKGPCSYWPNRVPQVKVWRSSSEKLVIEDHIWATKR